MGITKADFTTKVVAVLIGLVVTLSSAYVTLLVYDIRGDISTVSEDMEKLEDGVVANLLSQVNQIQLDLNADSYNKRTLLDKLDRLEEDIEDLEEKVK